MIINGVKNAWVPDGEYPPPPWIENFSELPMRTGIQPRQGMPIPKASELRLRVLPHNQPMNLVGFPSGDNVPSRDRGD